MPSLAQHQSTKTTKALVIAPNGGGKTGALASLAKAGYNLRIIDLDNGLDVLANLLRDDKAAFERVKYETITDPMKKIGDTLVPTRASAWPRVVKMLSHWKNDSEDFGPLDSWTPQEVLVIDSMTMLGIAAINYAKSLNGRLGKAAHQSDWYEGQQLIESMVQMLYDESIKCNVIINCHITYIGEENGPQHGYPATLGKALSPKIGSYFNTILGVRTVGVGSTAKQKIITRSYGMVELKNSNPLGVAAEYPIETGLADYFRAVRGQSAAPTTASKPTP